MPAFRAEGTAVDRRHERIHDADLVEALLSRPLPWWPQNPPLLELEPKGTLRHQPHGSGGDSPGRMAADHQGRLLACSIRSAQADPGGCRLIGDGFSAPLAGIRPGGGHAARAGRTGAPAGLGSFPAAPVEPRWRAIGSFDELLERRCPLSGTPARE